MTSLDEKIEIMQAARAGKPIEYRYRYRSGPADGWTDCPATTWNWADFEYRVKQVPLEAWVVLEPSGHPRAVFATLQGAKRYVGDFSCFRIVHMREVQEGGNGD